MVYSLMVPSLLKVGFHILLLFSFHVDRGRAMSSNDYIGSSCTGASGDYEGDSFRSNMHSAFSSLTNDDPPALFANVTAGGGSDRVYCLVQCRGDVAQADCNDCISNSTQQIDDTYCSNAKDAIIWYEKCQLRYSDNDFFGRLNVDDYNRSLRSSDEVKQPENFTKTLDGLLKTLTHQATTEPSSRVMFATGNIPYEGLQTLYGLVQCTMDTRLTDCSQCLISTISKISSTCKDHVGALVEGCEIVTGSCRVRFGTELFYTPTPTPSPSPNPALPSNSSLSPSPNSAPPLNSTQSPSPSTGSSNTSSDKANHSNVISVTMITVVAFALTSMYLFIVPSWL